MIQNTLQNHFKIILNPKKKKRKFRKLWPDHLDVLILSQIELLWEESKSSKRIPKVREGAFTVLEKYIYFFQKRLE